MTPAELKTKLFGCFDLLFLFPRGIAAFAGEKRTAIRTVVLIELLLAPLMPITAAMVPPVGMEGLPYSQIMKTVLAHYVLASAASLLLTWQVAGLLKKQDRFWLGLEAGAWCSLVFTTLVMIPLLLLDHFKLVPETAMGRVYTTLAVYGFIFGGCITYAVYRINIFFIIGWSMAGLFISRESWNILYALQGIPLLK